MMKDLEMLRELSLAERVGRLHRLWRTVADLELAPLEAAKQPRRAPRPRKA